MRNEHALRLLDFYRIREDAAGYCLSEEGREAVLADLPRTEAAEVAELKEGALALLDLMRSDVEPPRVSFPPIAEAARRASKAGSSLEAEELYALGLWAESYAAFAAWALKAAPGTPCAAVPAPEERGRGAPGRRAAPAGAATGPGAEAPEAPRGLLLALLAAAPDLSGVSRVVFRVLNKDGTLRDLPELREARERITRAHRDIAAITDSFFRDPEIRSMLQSDAPTQRDGRTVLALRANFKGRVRGIVHEVSSSGQTVFVEPEELVSRNNDLVQEEARYRVELQRILRETTERLLPEAEAVAGARRAMAGLDGLYARARHAKVSGLVPARDLASGLVLRGARHPLLGSKAVPIDVELPEGTRTLIITGPNTGGKTVSLKTIGLYALMNQFGLCLPAAPETGLAVFDEVYADIGDEQSIDQSLSTFSGHMKVIGGIVTGAGPRSLVLLDELGSGTDPEEGCAVAMSLLDCFIEKGSLVVLTTHHGILKNYGYTRPGCLNASMDFDGTSLMPTYRVLMGVPGESRALEVAAHHGLPKAIVEGARRYLDEERADVSELIKGLTEKHRKLEDLESERRSRLREAREERRKADLARLKLRQKEVELREQGVGELRRLLSESRKTLENLVKELREGGIGVDSTKAVKEFLAGFAEAVGREEEGLESLRTAPVERSEPEGRGDEEAAEGGKPGRRAAGREGGGAPARPLVVEEGAEVLVGAAKSRGTVLRAAKKGYWLVETGSLRLTLAEADLLPVPPAETGRAQVAVELAPREATGRTTAVFELNLRGFRLAEALEAVEKQLDAAALQGLGLFSIIHGTGEGILGKGIHDFLRKQPGVADFHFARPEEGGYGKTVVRLK